MHERSPPPDPLQTESEIASVTAALKKRRQRKQKSGRAADVKLKLVTRPTRLTGDVVHRDVPDPSQRRVALSQHLEHLDTLPAKSAFAKHRRQMLRTALSLLDRCQPHLPLHQLCAH